MHTLEYTNLISKALHE